ncbi:MAG: MBL fold metallo-hydrolase [bacterium]
MRVCVLGSGSGGNCTYVASETTAILIDAGLSGRATGLRLAECGVSVESIQAICVTHEHSDHTSGLAVLHGGGRVKLYANHATIEGIEARVGADKKLQWNIFSTGSNFQIGDLSIDPFSVPHDAYDPVGFIIRCGGTRVGVVTDMGVVTGLIRERLRACNVLVIESNHDEQMLKDADRPWHLKQRISGRQGHLSNQHAAELLTEIAGPHLKSVFLAHLSSECNSPELALRTVVDALKKKGHPLVRVMVAPSERVSEIWQE